MNSHKLNMYAGAVIGSLLFFLLVNFFADLIYVGRGHHDDPLAFVVEVEDAGGHAAEAADTVDYAALLAGADAAAGEKVFGKCKACHALEAGKNGVGPSLYGIVGEKIASVAGYSFSDALAGREGEWDLETLAAWLEDPKGFAPGTKMSFSGLPKAEDRVNLIAYLNQHSDSPKELTAAAAPAAAAETVAATDTTAAASSEPASALSFAAGDAAAGEKVFRKCRACHSLEQGKNGVGPSLYGIVGEKVAAAEGYSFSDALMAKAGESWTPEMLDQWLADPKGFAAGTKMVFPGLKEVQDRIDVITYLNQQSDHPVELK